MIITDEGLMPIYENFPFQIWLETQMPEEIFIPSDYLLCYLVSNQIQGTVNGEANTYNAGDLFIIHPGDSYIIQAQDSYLLCIVRMDFNFILRCCDYQLPRFDHPILGIHLPSGTKERIIGQLIEKICYLTDLYYMAPKPSRTRMTYVFFDFAHFLIENFQKDFEETTPQHRRIFQIRDYLETNFSQPISLNMLAQNLGLTPQYLSSFIKEHFECTFGEYLNTVRLNHVAYDLVYTQNTITQIMYQNGFPNASGFNHAFKKRYSMTALEYRRTARAQHFGDMPKSPDAAFMAISQKNYKVFCSFRKNSRLPVTNSGKTHQLSLDVSKTLPLAKPWGRILNLGTAAMVLNTGFVQALEQVCSHISFKYGRIKDLSALSPENCVICLDTLLRHGLTPFIVISPSKAYGSRPNDFLLQLKDFLRQIGICFGAASMASWKIEWAMPEGYSIAGALEASIQMFKAVRQILPNTSVGGPAFPMERSFEDLKQLLAAWKEEDFIPDFISFTACPYSPNFSLSPEGLTISDPDILPKRTATALQIINQTFKSEKNTWTIPELYIVDCDYEKKDYNTRNDTLFMSSFLTRNHIMVKDLAAAFASPSLSDLEPRPAKSVLLQGGRGMLTSSGIYKPSFFAMMFLNLLGENCIHSSENDIITMDSTGRIIALLFNYSHPGTDTAVINLRLAFHYLPEKNYQVTRLVVNEKWGSIFHRLDGDRDLGCLPLDVKEQLRQSIWPHVSITSEKNTNVLNHSEFINPQEMIAIILTPQE